MLFRNCYNITIPRTNIITYIIPVLQHEKKHNDYN